MSNNRSLNDIIFEGIYTYRIPKKARRSNTPGSRKGRKIRPFGSNKYDSFVDIFKSVGFGADVHITDIYQVYMKRPAPDSTRKIKQELDRHFNNFNQAKRGFVIVRGLLPYTKKMVIDDGSYTIKKYSKLSANALRKRREREEEKLRNRSIDKWAPAPDDPEDKLGFSHLDIQVLKFL